MSKYIIEIEEKPLCVFDKDTQTYFPRLWRVKGFNSLVLDEEGLSRLDELNSDYINEHFGDLQDTAYKKGLAEGKKATWELVADASSAEYQRGLNDSWEAARKLFSSMADSDIEKVFPTEWNNGGFHALINLQPQEVIAKLKAYEADEDVKRGDIVRHKINGLTYIVTLASDCGYVLLGNDGNFATSCITNTFEKTGKHFDIDKILEEMKGDNDK